MGWASDNPGGAWSHFEPGFKAGDWGEEKSSTDGYLQQHIASIILGKWARESPEKVWDLVNEQGEDLGFQPKVWNAVLEGFPNGREWETIARDLEDLWSKGALEPRSLEEARVPDVLFARWANEDPASALQWFESEADAGMTGQGSPQQIGEWFGRYPESAASWIDQRVREGSQKYEVISWAMAKHRLSRDTLRWSRSNPNDQDRYHVFAAAVRTSFSPSDQVTPMFIDNSVIYFGGGSTFEIEFLEQELPAFRLTAEQEAEIREMIQKGKEARANRSVYPFGE